MKGKVLVIGATGLIGKIVAQQLKKDDYSVRILSRDRRKAKSLFPDEYEIIEADILTSDSLSQSFAGIDYIYINLPPENSPQAIPNIIKYSKENNITHLAYTSGCTVREENAWHPMIKGHFEAENLLVESGIPYSIFRLTMVMDMIPRYANKGKPFIIGKQPHKWSWIYSGDLAMMASKAFSLESAKNKKFTVFGPDKYTIPEAVDKFNSIFYTKTKPAKPKPYWLANLLALIVGVKLKYAISIFKYFEDHPEEGNPKEANELLGQPKTDLNRFFDIYKSK